MSAENVFFRPTLADAFAEVGLLLPEGGVQPGQLVRFPTSDKRGDMAGWCKVFPDGKGAVFGCNRQDTKFVWQQRDEDAPPPSRQERRAVRAKAAQAKQAAEREREAKRAKGAEMANHILGQTIDLDPTHTYVTRKGITPYAARQGKDGAIVVPVYGSDGKLQSLQFIYASGDKRFLAQAAMKGGRLFLGDPIDGEPMILCEGWATGCSARAAADMTVVVCFSGSNMAEVAKVLRQQFPASLFYVAADLDEHGKGMKYAQGATAVGAPATVVAPVFADERACGDFNDLHQAEGVDIVRQQIARAAAEQVHVMVPFQAPGLFGCDVRDGTEHSRPLTEYGNALRLFDLYGTRLRFVHDSDTWLVWDGSAWHWDLAGATVRSFAASLRQPIYEEGAEYLVESEHFARWARKSQEWRVVVAAVKLLSDFNAVRLPLSCVDADPLLIGFDQARQVIDLRTGATRAASPRDYVTKSLNVSYVGDMHRAERWIQFLDQIFDGDRALIDWLHRFCGYLLTGSTEEQLFVFCYGHGANGKSVFIELLKYVLGDYARAIASETLAESRRQAGAATPDLAALIGARLVLCSETEDNTALAESLVKSLVSGDSMSVRQLYSPPVQFTPAFKLVMAGNHKPIVRGNDNGIWRRIRLVPFNRTFAPEERDRHLLDKLKAEAQHILAWLVEGCLRWQREGLAKTPAAVEGATDEYREDQDIVGRWLDERTKRSPHSEVSASDLYASYHSWCMENGLRPASTVALGRRLGERGFEPRKSNGKRLWVGLTLTAALQADIDSYLRATQGF